MSLELLQKAARQIYNGNYKNILSGIDNRTSSTLVEKICEGNAAQWQVTEEMPPHICRVSDGEYISVEQRHTIPVGTDIDVRAIEVPLISPSLARELRISVDTADNETQEYTITIEPSYEYPPVLWKTIKLRDGDTLAEFTVETEPAPGRFKRFPQLVSRFSRYSALDSTRVGSPAIVPAKPNPPVFLISIDTLRWDSQDELAPLIDALGDDATTISEPRTQGVWTPPSHASMFTGTHPGNHGYVGWGKESGDKRPIDPELTTIPEILSDVGYKCSGLVSHSQILPEFGFGRGFHRFHHDQMGYSDWVTRNGDATSSVDRMTAWIDRDLKSRTHSLFYFLHVFDLHNPYVPPMHCFDTADIDFSAARQYEDQIDMLQDREWTYLDGYARTDAVEEPLVQKMRDWYSKSIGYTATQIARLVDHLKTADIFDDSLIIVTGDHGEEFGERGFYTHTSLYDANIRPFMAVKPPKGACWDVPREVDTIDFLPTIAELVDVEPPSACEGRAMQAVSSPRPRISERIYPDWYNVAVEVGETKGIFTYETNYPNRPSSAIVESGPELTEWYDISDIRAGQYDETNGSADVEKRIRGIAEEFVLDAKSGYSTAITAQQPSQETMDHLEKLGYK